MFSKSDYVGKQVKSKLSGKVGIITDAVKWNGVVMFWVTITLNGWQKAYFENEVEIL